jgi:hypothetical protein
LGKICRPSGTRPIPARPIWSALLRSIASPRKRTVPRRGRSSPVMERTVVVLPMPLRPSSVTISPCSILSPTPNSAWLAP